MTERYGAAGLCSECGKMCFLTRKTARSFMRKRYPQENMSVYRCGNYFHFGHTPTMIKGGHTDRRTYAERKNRAAGRSRAS